MRYAIKERDGNPFLSNCGGILSVSHDRSFSRKGRAYIILFEAETEAEKNSSKTRKILFDLLEDTAATFLESETERFNTYNHTVRTISDQLSQKIDGYFGDKKWYSNNYGEALDNIENTFLVNKDETKKLVHYFNKIATDLRNHIEGWEIIYVRDKYEPDFSQVSLKKAILNQFSSFAEEFDDLSIKVKFSEHFSGEYTVMLDKKLFSLIMYNFLSNALKYSKPGEEIHFHYRDDIKSLDVSMYSSKIEQHELKQIFQEGIRGIHANSTSSSGRGSGLFVIAKALSLMGMNNMIINPQYQKIKQLGDVMYVENHFHFGFAC